tara:strand:+ start:17641 stop:18438 length:798 start_codon:yes stop_codon:yes gene_type:complete
MKTLWLTYAWKDNEDGDVEYLAQELRSEGIEVLIDKFTIGAGNHLWSQIDQHISNPDKSDAWAIFATEASLQSKACQEELQYAISRAVSNRGEQFPLIGIFPGNFAADLIPSALSSRLCVSLEDNEWRTRVGSAVKGESFNVDKQPISPFSLKIHNLGEESFALEIRPRAGSIHPIGVAYPQLEAEKIRYIYIAPSGYPHPPTMLVSSEGTTDDGMKLYAITNQSMTPTNSLYIHTKGHLSEFKVGKMESPTYIKWLFTGGIRPN